MSAAAGKLYYTVEDLGNVLPGVGRPARYEIMRRLGRKIGKKYVVAAVALHAWLEQPDALAGGENTRPS